jgi:hypothetical protein
MGRFMKGQVQQKMRLLRGPCRHGQHETYKKGMKVGQKAQVATLGL